MPCLRRIAAEFGDLAIHYCGNLATTGHQFAEVLSRCGFVKLVHTQLEPYLADSDTNRRTHNFKLASIWEIDDFPGFLRSYGGKLRQSKGAMFFVQVKARGEGETLIQQWPELRAELLD
jgi:hypothetical protein